MLLFGYGYVYLFIPETRGLTLEEVYTFFSLSPCGESHSCMQVDEMYRAGIKPWNSTDWKPHLGEEAHKNVLEGLHREQDEEKRASSGS
jgi:SP family sugar:H+ symporter-like MFS transporter